MMDLRDAIDAVRQLRSAHTALRKALDLFPEGGEPRGRIDRAILAVEDAMDLVTGVRPG